ncbi:MAG: zinc ribbon domain-containing protein [Acidobacteria bacterium]|nr:zinc ribbon domain-containing protein [Acidobacteriota bacterium]
MAFSIILPSAMAADASSLYCPNCGTAADPEAHRCPYCSARLATVGCPACFALMFAGSAFCPTCGARLARLEHGDAAARCPACRSVMQSVDVGPTALMECAACDGVWVNADAFERLCTDQDMQAAVLHRFCRADRSSHRPGTLPPVRAVRQIDEPRQLRPPVRTVVDVCRGHGTYLDAGKLHRIVSFIHAGGLERARARRMEELRDEERRIKDLQRKAMLDHNASRGRRSATLQATWERG